MIRKNNYNILIMKYLLKEDKLSYSVTLKVDKSPGLVKIYPGLLKKQEGKWWWHWPLFPNLTLIQEWCRRTAEYINVSLLKKGERDHPSNCMPVCSTLVLEKPLELILRPNIILYWELHKLMRKSQQGFGKEKSSLTDVFLGF